MKQYEVIITEEASNDMRDIYEYISKDLKSPYVAEKQYIRLANAICSLDFFPARCPIVSQKGKVAVRAMVEDNYVICYTMDEENVIVIGIIYGASDVAQKIDNRI